MKNDFKIINDSGDKKYFTIIPNYILNHSTHLDREVYIQMKRITGEDGTCWASQKTLAKQCGMSINRLKKSLSYLLDHGWIKQIGKKEVNTKGGIQKVNEYKIADLWKMYMEFYGNKKGVSLGDTAHDKGVSQNWERGIKENDKGVSLNDDKEEPIINNNQERIIIGQASLEKQIIEAISLFREVNPMYMEFYKSPYERKAMGKVISAYGFDKTKKLLLSLSEIVSKKFAPRITKPTELKRDIGKFILFSKQLQEEEKERMRRQL